MVAQNGEEGPWGSGCHKQALVKKKQFTTRALAPRSPCVHVFLPPCDTRVSCIYATSQAAATHLSKYPPAVRRSLPCEYLRPYRIFRLFFQRMPGIWSLCHVQQWRTPARRHGVTQMREGQKTTHTTQTTRSTRATTLLVGGVHRKATTHSLPCVRHVFDAVCSPLPKLEPARFLFSRL